MKIYTKTGDQGETQLLGGGPYPKDYIRIEAYGALDELNASLGCIAAPQALPELLRVQEELFVLGTELASLGPQRKNFIQASHTLALEKEIDAWEAELPPLKRFILPGGHPAASELHRARTICRRAERRAVTLAHREELRPEVLKYLNRLSDWLFVLARRVNFSQGVPDREWLGL